ncbi:MAG: hypothetical protein AAFO28_07100, partial [Pseudomonadota bacterium]
MNAPFRHVLKDSEVLAEALLLDELASLDRPERAFLRGAWFLAGPNPASLIVIARDQARQPIAAFPLMAKPVGPWQLGITVKQIAGPYWPMRGMPVKADTPVQTLAAALRDKALRKALGPAFRLGPALEGDPSLQLLREAAEQAGWRILSKPVSELFALDLAALTASGTWPSAKGQQKDRWRIRQLEKTGPVSIEHFSAATWTLSTRDAIAAIEAHSWVGQLDEGG